MLEGINFKLIVLLVVWVGTEGLPLDKTEDSDDNFNVFANDQSEINIVPESPNEENGIPADDVRLHDGEGTHQNPEEGERINGANSINREYNSEDEKYEDSFGGMVNENMHSKREKRYGLNIENNPALNAEKYDGVFGGFPQYNGQAKRVKRSI